jgi:hypothetical protein
MTRPSRWRSQPARTAIEKAGRISDGRDGRKHGRGRPSDGRQAANRRRDNGRPGPQSQPRYGTAGTITIGPSPFSSSPVSKDGEERRSVVGIASTNSSSVSRKLIFGVL